MTRLRVHAVVGAIALLLGVPAGALERPESADVTQNYLLYCGGCHGLEGAGVPHKVPALRGGLGRLLRADGGRELLLRFPGVANSALSDAALADVMNWCVEKFAGTERPEGLRPFVAAEVRAARASPLLNIRRARRELLGRLGAQPSEAADY